ncbi:hypothetical protein CD351_11745 [Erythrobacter sp. KY5]|uniref:hypothetical protein n=1 Tax=Erythrobacter sp. KY5 TaxID=2011159 RepID=UPI000DBF1E1E|nr:hypothetical protein [Erythrobacter sp. KY5]AWW75100.1 hypothetical protein CD351_11745 [Erythrobacter sp. KY5]
MSAQTPRPFIPAAEALPALIEMLPPDSDFSGQLRFARKRQAGFLRKLADCGEVRAAAKASAVSHQTVYRMRRASPVFRAAMDAAFLIARELAEDLLASRAMNGIEEEVYYHGEVVATRRRYSDRLLLAHLARLDRLAEREDVAVVAGSFDDLIEAFETAEDESEDAFGQFVPGPCNMRSTSDRALDQEGADDVGEDMEEEAYCSPDIESLEERLCAMDDARPDDAPLPSALASKPEEIDEIEALQLAAFEAGDTAWWKVTGADAKKPGNGAEAGGKSGFHDSEKRRILKAP